MILNNNIKKIFFNFFKNLMYIYIYFFFFFFFFFSNIKYRDTEDFLKNSRELVVSSIYKLNDEIKSILVDYSKQYASDTKEKKSIYYIIYA